jgi:hypothetical protein
MRRRLFTSMVAVVGLLVATASIKADDWTSFWPVGYNVSVSFVRVNNSTYAWKFRNDGYNIIKYMKFTYSYFDADSGQFRTDVDFLPGRLSPGAVIGGWAAFSANTRSQPTLQIVEIERE